MKKIPKIVLEGFWQASVKSAEAFFKTLPEEVPLLKRKILETVFARFCYESTVETIKDAGCDPAEWEAELNAELEIFRALLLGLTVPRFNEVFKILEERNIDAIALARKEEYYSQISTAYPHPFLVPFIEILTEMDRRWFCYLWQKHEPTEELLLVRTRKTERMRRVGKAVMSEAQMVIARLFTTPYLG